MIGGIGNIYSIPKGGFVGDEKYVVIRGPQMCLIGCISSFLGLSKKKPTKPEHSSLLI